MQFSYSRDVRNRKKEKKELRVKYRVIFFYILFLFFIIKFVQFNFLQQHWQIQFNPGLTLNNG